VWEAAKYEGSPYTFPEVATLLDGVTVGGHSLSDQALILGLADAAKVMLGHVRDGTFNLAKAISDDLNARIAASEAEVDDHGHQALLYFPFATLSQFYFDGNKRTARWMMNGHLMSHGYEPIGVPVEIRQQWHSALSSLYTTLDASELLRILADCQFSRIEERSQGHP
jgi:hypothetical protein